MLTILTLISLVLTVQAAHALYLMIYTWDQPEAGDRARVPDRRAIPTLSFTAILPARHEEEVIQHTIARAASADYPPHLVQILVVCSADDVGTIEQAQTQVNRLRAMGRTNVEVVVFDDGPINKPHGLNTALRYATNDVVAIFDAEDEVQPQLFDIVNTIMSEEDVGCVQAGVQLMNFDSNWYSTFNVLEYFFWFRSRLHYHAKNGAIPLGGNTVFFKRGLIERLGGWDESNLTEDADIGLRISSMGEKVRVVYDDRYVTKEETPPTLQSFIKQRTRWCQGFMQTLGKGTWKLMPTRRQRFLAWYTLAFPHVQAMLGIYLPVALLSAFVLTVPVPVAMLSWLPVLLLGAHFVMSVVGLYEFTGAHGLKATPATVVKMAITWFPYQMVLSYAAARALWRQVKGERNWEKTAHVGAHRTAAETAELTNVG
ncbi:glycosyltransferase [Dactylosporangium aurantiacum]|uniref:glycosyltransferase n=1 Tax=Dactylosporangium aurantiacum TaxID=35754 RepID=UPI001FDF915A|nr:glycosyltransferase [Dactylosporangium aurantiacum]MDG6102837.1 glycosyltransferase [Dactylosporangium aurantiacum]